jgi:hypothetical protein
MTMVPVDMAGGVFSFGEENGAKMAANAMPPPPRLTLFYSSFIPISMQYLVICGLG